MNHTHTYKDYIVKNLTTQQMLENIELLLPLNIKERIQLRRATDGHKEGVLAICIDDNSIICLLRTTESGYMIFDDNQDIVGASFEYLPARKLFIGRLIEQYTVTKH